METTRRGIWFDQETGEFRTADLRMKFDFGSGQTEVRGPKGFVEHHLDLNRALETARMFLDHTPSIGMALALAIQGQFATWSGTCKFGLTRQV